MCAMQARRRDDRPGRIAASGGLALYSFPVEENRGPDDVTLVHRVLAGDEAAFRAIVERYGDRVLRFCRARLWSDEDAADAAQEVFLRAFRSLPRFRLGESFAAWLFAIAANRVRTRRSRLETERLREERAANEAAADEAAVAGETAARAPDPASLVVRSLQAEELRLQVAALPEDLRRTVEMYYFAELPVADCARALGLGEEAIKSRLFRARRRLRGVLDRAQREPPSEGTR